MVSRGSASSRGSSKPGDAGTTVELTTNGARPPGIALLHIYVYCFKISWCLVACYWRTASPNLMLRCSTLELCVDPCVAFAGMPVVSVLEVRAVERHLVEVS